MKRFMIVTAVTLLFAVIASVSIAQNSPNQEISFDGLWLFITVSAIMLTLYIGQKLLRNPMTAGPAMVSGRVSSETAVSQFQINSIWPAKITPNDIVSIEVEDAEKGLVRGLCKIQYSDNSFRYIFLRNIICFRSMVRSNTHEPWFQEYMLQNGARCIPIFAFRFVPIEVIAENSQPAVCIKTATNKIKKFSFRPATGSLKNLVELEGFEKVEVEEKESGQISIRFV